MISTKYCPGYLWCSGIAGTWYTLCTRVPVGAMVGSLARSLLFQILWLSNESLKSPLVQPYEPTSRLCGLSPHIPLFWQGPMQRLATQCQKTLVRRTFFYHERVSGGGTRSNDTLFFSVQTRQNSPTCPSKQEYTAHDEGRQRCSNQRSFGRTVLRHVVVPRNAHSQCKADWAP